MNPRKDEETLPSEQDPWAAATVEMVEPENAVIDVHTEYGHRAMRVFVREVEGRLRAWKVEVSVAFNPADWSEPWAAVTPRMLATAPLVAAETMANLPSERWWLEGRPEIPQDPAELVVPDVRPYPMQFWEDVAARYIADVLWHGIRNPAVWIAEETGAPVATVRGWIAKCRELGLIAKGSQGRVG
jgi:hypothetical protein